MGMTFFVNEEAAWMPNSRRFDYIFAPIADALKLKEPSISAEIVTWIEDYYGPIINISDWDQPRFRIFLDAVIKAYKRTVDTLFNPRSEEERVWLDPPDLKVVLLLDPRSGSNLQNFNCSIVVRENVIWTARAWAYDFVLEQLANALLRDGHAASARLLVRNCTLYGGRRCDLSELDAQTMAGFVDAVCSRIAPGHVWVGDSYAPEFETYYYPRLAELYNFFRHDPRIVHHEGWDMWSGLTKTLPK